MNLPRSFSLVVAMVGAAAAVGAGCGGEGVSLVDEPLLGFVDADTDRPFGDHISFNVGRGQQGWPDCATLDATITFDGEVASEGVIGGNGSGPYNYPTCNGIGIGASTVTDDGRWRDGTLDVASSDGDARYTGRNLLGLRQLNALDASSVRAGQQLRWQHEPRTDVVLLEQAQLQEPALWSFDVAPDVWITSLDEPWETAQGVVLDPVIVDGEIAVALPGDLAAGSYVIDVQYVYAVPAVVCEGFRSCEVLGMVEARFTVDVL